MADRSKDQLVELIKLKNDLNRSHLFINFEKIKLEITLIGLLNY